MPQATGTFDVTLTAQPLSDSAASPMLARRAMSKTFHGDLEATSSGEMLSAGTPTSGSAGYVAIEQVTGALHGRRGTFVLQHSATMDRGQPSLSITVVPDSGSDQLVGLRGRLDILIDKGHHSYTFDYTLPDTSA